MKSPRFARTFVAAALMALSFAACSVNPPPSQPGTAPGPTSPVPTDPNSPTSPSSPSQPQPGNPGNPPSSGPGSETPPSAAACVRTGCSNTVCAEAGKEIMTTCEYRNEYECYGTAKCERQANGACGWTQTPALSSCIANARK